MADGQFRGTVSPGLSMDDGFEEIIVTVVSGARSGAAGYRDTLTSLGRLSSRLRVHVLRANYRHNIYYSRDCFG